MKFTFLCFQATAVKIFGVFVKTNRPVRVSRLLLETFILPSDFFGGKNAVLSEDQAQLRKLLPNPHFLLPFLLPPLSPSRLLLSRMDTSQVEEFRKVLGLLPGIDAPASKVPLSVRVMMKVEQIVVRPFRPSFSSPTSQGS